MGICCQHLKIRRLKNLVLNFSWKNETWPHGACILSGLQSARAEWQLPLLTIGGFVIKTIFQFKVKLKIRLGHIPTFVVLKGLRKWIDSLTGISTKSKSKTGMSFDLLFCNYNWTEILTYYFENELQVKLKTFQKISHWSSLNQNQSISLQRV